MNNPNNFPKCHKIFDVGGIYFRSGELSNMGIWYIILFTSYGGH